MKENESKVSCKVFIYLVSIDAYTAHIFYTYLIAFAFELLFQIIYFLKMAIKLGRFEFNKLDQTYFECCLLKNPLNKLPTTLRLKNRDFEEIKVSINNF